MRAIETFDYKECVFNYCLYTVCVFTLASALGGMDDSITMTTKHTS